MIKYKLQFMSRLTNKWTDVGAGFRNMCFTEILEVANIRMSAGVFKYRITEEE